ncbi:MULTISPECIES: hypothetical protein [unclassified Novosphingobium]|uniref:hypothetical protein n=1 Tax=unclassified Novosphingobium TaxID=2644732 RepID=UPI0013586E86|nr:MULTISPECIES: hypothetical protein [unclassified Novosphingobium]
MGYSFKLDLSGLRDRSFSSNYHRRDGVSGCRNPSIWLHEKCGMELHLNLNIMDILRVHPNLAGT